LKLRRFIVLVVLIEKGILIGR